MTIVSQPNIFDSTQATRMRRDLQDPSGDGIREVAKQFESLFVQIMLKSMRQATPGDGLFSSNEMEQFQDLHDQQLSMSVSQGEGLGIAAMVERQLLEQSGQQPSGGGPDRGRGIADYLPLPAAAPAAPQQKGGRDKGGLPSVESIKATRPPADGFKEKTIGANPVSAGDRGNAWETPEDFVRGVWPAAVKAAEEIGADPRALVAQAALETGWGQHVIRRGDGSSAQNLFGIKAHSTWEGERVRVSTVEYRGGIAGREMAEFRAYDSLEDSFRDYLNFLQQNPRYSRALEVTDDPVAFTNELQRAGYATDPRYASKIQQIMNGQVMQAALPQLKRPDFMPIPT